MLGRLAVRHGHVVVDEEQELEHIEVVYEGVPVPVVEGDLVHAVLAGLVLYEVPERFRRC